MNFRLFHQKYVKEIQAIGLIFLIVAEMIVFPPPAAYAATYNWTQAAWTGGVSGVTATHASNQSNWTYYAAADAGLSIGANITETANMATTSVTNFYARSAFDLGSGIMVAVGTSGFIQRTTDSGATWKNLTPLTTQQLNEVTCSSGSCYAVGNNGVILKSADSGATWSALSSGTTNVLTDVTCTDANTCWVIDSTTSAVRKTTNGSSFSTVGNTGVAPGASGDISFVGDIGWVTITNSPNVYKSTNGGTNWGAVGLGGCVVVTGPDYGDCGYSVGVTKVWSIDFADANTGYMTFSYEFDNFDSEAFYGAIAKTTNGGTSWSWLASSFSPGLDDYAEINVLDATHAVAGRWYDAEYATYTTNGTSVTHKAMDPASNTWPKVTCSSATSCVGATDNIGMGPVTTTDGWTSVSAHDSPWTGAVARTNGGGYFVSASTGWLVTTGGSIKKTTDGGATWATQTSGVATTLDSIYCTDSSTCWAGGASGVILATTNGGTNWSAQTSGTANALYAVDFISSTVGYAVGASGTIVATTNGGTNWTVQTSGTANNLYGLDCYDANTCWAVGASGTIVATTNGGTNWSAQTSGVATQLNDVHFVSSTVGWTVGASGVIRKTTTGGSSWAGQTDTAGGTNNTIKCIDENTCYAGADSNIFKKTSNGGTNWSPTISAFQTTYNLTWINIIPGTTGVAVISGMGAIITLAPEYSASQQTLTSSIYDSGDAGNLLSQITWDEVVSGGSTAQFQIRTSADNNTWTSYLGPDGTTGTYFSNAAAGCSGSGTVTCSISDAISIGDGASDRYYQYKAYLTPVTTAPATIDNLVVQYVVNVAPNFDSAYAANGVSVAQNATTTSPIGHAVISYSVRDQDTTAGSPGNAGYITPSFEYNLNDGVGWQNITSGYLAAGDTNPKAVAEVAYNTYTATWNAASQLGTAVSTTTAQIRVTANDLEGANNTITATETGVTIDTTPPVASSAVFNGVTGLISLTSTDLMSQSMRISNNADSSADGVNADSGNWIATTSTKAWTPPADKTIYLALRDQFGNTATTTIVGVASTTAMNIRDVSNPAETNPRLFTSWAVHADIDGATFANYKIYRGTSSDAEVYLATVSNSAQNYYIDAAVASTTRYYYKVTVVDTNGDESGYSDEVNGIPNGQGFGTDLVAPIISSVVVSNVKATTADVTWSTDELSDSFADYSISPSTAFGTTVSSPSFMTGHTISLTGLTPSTTYLVRVRSQDVYSNIGSSNNGGAGYSFTTTGGPAISAVAVTEVTDTTATIEWNTDKDASSLVFYSTNSTLSGATQAGSASLVGGAGVAGVWQHSVTLTGLTQQTKYYFKVRSLDTDDNIGEDTNSGVYFYFNTTLDTAPPTFSAIDEILTTSDSVVVGWQTNKKATTYVAYGLSSGVYTMDSTLDTSMTINHSAALLGLTESTPYFYVVASVDANGNAATSTEQTFTTNAVTVITRSTSYCSPSSLAALVEEATTAKDIVSPTVTNVKVEPGSSSAKITLTASEPASVFIQYGEDIANGYASMHGSFDYLVSPVLTLPGLKMGTTYHYSVKAQDRAGNTSNTPDATFATQYLSEPTEAQQLEDQSTFRQKIENILESALPSLSPPFLSEPRVTSVTSDSAVIEWDTNISASSLVAFAPSEAYLPTATNPYIGQLGSAQERVKNHKVELIGLDSATTYHAQAVSQGVVGPFGKSVDFTFITKPSVPEVSILEVGPNKISIGWKTNSLTSSFVEYRNLRTGELQTKGTDDLIHEHVVTLEELNPNTRYELKVFGRDARGNRTESVSRVVSTVVDATSPKLMNVKINNALVPGRTDRLQTIVSWQTDELADSQVFYGEGAAVGAELKSKTPLDSVLTTDHTAVISTLKPGTVYRFRVISVDQVGNKTESPIQVILTPQQAESIIDVISSNLEQSFGWIKLIQQ